MKTIRGTLATLLLFVAAALRAQTKTLPAVVDAGRVRIAVSGSGSDSGDSIRLLVVKSSESDARELPHTVPPGTKLASTTDSCAQSMVVGRVRGRETGPPTFVSTSTVVAGVRPVSYIFEAHCIELAKDNSSEWTSFRVHVSDPKLACFLQKALGDGFSVEAVQAAVWIRTDEVTFEHTVQKFPVNELDFRRAAEVVRCCHSRH